MAAFFRLVRRPAFALLLPLSGLLLVMLFVMTLNEDLERARQLDLSMLALPAVLGLIVGHTAHDVRCRSFAWTLPRLQGRLAASVAGIALGTAVLWTWGYRSLGGEVGATAALAGFLLVFVVCAAAQRSIAVVGVALLAAAVWAGPFFGFLRAQPIVWTLFALAASAVCFHACFRREAARRAVLGSHLLQIVNLFNPDEIGRAEQSLLGRSRRTRPWRAAFLGTETGPWVRAIEHGSFGRRSRAGVALRVGLFCAYMGLLMVSPAFLNGRAFDAGLAHAYHIVFDPPVPLEDEVFVPVPLFLAAWAWTAVVSGTSALQRGWVYPVSRRQRGLIVYRMSLRQSVRIAWTISVTLLLIGALIALLRGTGELVLVPGFAKSLIAVLVLVPAVQRLPTWIDRRSHGTAPGKASLVLVWLGIVPFGGLVYFATDLWPRLFDEVAFPLQAALLLVLLVASQRLYYSVVMKHHRRADLI